LFTSENEGSRGARDAMETRDLITTYTKAFFDRYLLKKTTEIERLAFDGTEMIKKPRKSF
jgi:hypothetical protein